MLRSTGFVALGLSLGLSLGPIGCGGAAEQAAPASAAPAVVANPDTNAPLAGREPPAHAPLWFRFATPSADLRELAASSLARDPQLKFALENPDRILQATLGPALASSFDLDQPVDVLLPVKPGGKPQLTASFTPRDPVALVSGQASIRVVELAPGRWSLEPLDAAPPKVTAVCELWRVPAGAKLRIVCAPNADQLAAGAPFLTGAAAESKSDSSVRLELGGAALKEALTKSNSTPIPSDDPQRASREAGRRIAHSVLSRIDTWAAALTLNTTDVELYTDLGFGRDAPVDVQSWLGQDRSPPVDTFARLPRDADLSFAFAGIEHAAAERLLHQAARELAPALEERYELSAEYKEQLKSALAALIPNPSRFVLAVGRDEDEVRKLDARLREQEARGKPPQAKDVSALENELEGWVVIGLETDPARYIAALREAYRVTSVDPPARPAPAKSDGSPSAAPPAKDRESSRITIVASVPKGLPAGTLYWQRSVRPTDVAAAQERPRAQSYDQHFLAVPDESRLWIVGARTLPLAVQRARAQLAATAATGRSDALELAAASTAPLLGFGKVSVARLFTTRVDTEPGDALGGVRRRLALVDTLPNRGATTLPFWITLQSPGESTPHAFRLQTRLPQAALEDLVHWLKNRG